MTRSDAGVTRFRLAAMWRIHHRPAGGRWETSQEVTTMARQKLLEVCWAGAGNLRSWVWSWGA